MDKVKLELEIAERNQDWTKAGELKYGKIPELEDLIRSSDEASSEGLLEEEVTEKEIAQVVHRWTGIPVSNILEEERSRPTPFFFQDIAYRDTCPSMNYLSNFLFCHFFF